MPRWLELVLVGIMLVVALPVGALLAGLVARDLGRPVVFRQRRAGQDMTVITLAKFRTMRDADGADGNPLPDAQRVTGLGRALRRTRLDEIPQLFAIVRRDLALVGPRPLLPETVAGFGADGARRSAVRPGLTGWAQVSGNTRLGEAEKLSLDLWYVAHRSLWLDIRILWMTALTIVGGETRSEQRIAHARAWHAGRRRQETAP